MTSFDCSRLAIRCCGVSPNAGSSSTHQLLFVLEPYPPVGRVQVHPVERRRRLIRDVRIVHRVQILLALILLVRRPRRPPLPLARAEPCRLLQQLTEQRRVRVVVHAEIDDRQAGHAEERPRSSGAG